MLPTMDSLKFTSFLALISVAYVVILIVYYLFNDGVYGGRIHYTPRSFEEFFSTIPTFIFAFTCHQNIFSIRNETPDITKVNKIIVISVLISLAAYILIGYCGYFTYGIAIKDNIINNLNKTDIAVVICRIAVSLLVALSYPLQIHPCRVCVNNILETCFPMLRVSKLFHVFITLFLCAITYAIAFFVSDLGIVFSIVGATGSVIICYILPGVFYSKLYWQDSWFSKKFFAVLLTIVGVLLMINSLIWIIIKEINKSKEIIPLVNPKSSRKGFGYGMFDVVKYTNEEINRESMVEEHVDPGFMSFSLGSNAPGLEMFDLETFQWVTIPINKGVIWLGSEAGYSDKRCAGGIHRVKPHKNYPRVTIWYEVCTESQLPEEIFEMGLQRYVKSEEVKTTNENEETFPIFVKTFAGTKLTLDLNPNTTVDQIKERLELICGIPFAKSKMGTNIIGLEGSKTLKECGIKPYDVIMFFGAPKDYKFKREWNIMREKQEIDKLFIQKK